jgi:hypothetical protein
VRQGRFGATRAGEPGQLFQAAEQDGDHVLAVVFHRAAAIALQPDAVAVSAHVDRLLIQLAAAAAHLAVDPVGVSGQSDRAHIAAARIALATSEGAAIEIGQDVVRVKRHEQGSGAPG